ncbi:CHASE3 domain-containing protein [Polaromonas sp. CG_9.11]|uniref:CHASE3 domain-containing protein n=1 Tax=Polaromonas sp. CG_9.11 TaxID=2787730 RepID=UPI0018CABEAC|nr:CHASE3 domain-containing protein [Polaromonas sp. CG_9.11]MBG6076545.1 PAS domain S-box-containing protein [Polaromonas sp. CG_9.11]
MTAPDPQMDKPLRGPGSAGISRNLSNEAMQPVNKRLLVEAVLVFVLGCLAGVGWLAYRNMQAATNSERWETHSRVVIQELGELLSSLKDAETGQRGFVITGNPDYLAPYHESLKTFPIRLAQLRRLTADNPEEQQRLAALMPLAAAKFAAIKALILLRETQGLTAASESDMVESGKSAMDQIRLLVAQSQSQETQLLRDRALARQADSSKSVQTLLLASTLGGFALLLLLVCLRREQVSRRRAETRQNASEARYGCLFNSMDEGFCIIELIFDEHRQPIDCRCLEANPAFETHTGITGAAGRWISEIAQDQAADCIEMCAKVLETGKAARFVNQSKTVDRCLEGYASRIGGPKGTTIAVLVRDITARRHTEKALRESQRFLRSSLDALSGHIAVIDASGTILEINESWQRFADENQPPGVSASVIGIGFNYLDHCRQTLLHGGDTPAYVLAINDIIAGRRTRFEMEYPCHSPTEQRWFVMRVTRFQSAGSVRIVIVHDDCTEQKRAENALRESEERYRNLFNSMDEGFCIIDIAFNDQAQAVDCCFLEVNPAFALQTGMQGVAGKRWSECAPGREAQWLKACGKVALTGKPVRFNHEEKALDLRFDMYAARLGNAGSRKVAIVFSNITERAKAAEALRQSEQRFRALFDRGPVAMYSCDTSAMILEFNACAVKLWGRKPRQGDVDERFCGVSTVYRPDGTLLSAEQNPMIAVLKGEIPQVDDVEIVIERPDGSRITVVANIVPLKDGQGKIIGAINCFYDITERSRLERQTKEQAQALSELHRRKDEFLAMLSHELRNPLAPLASAAQLLRLQENQDPVYQQACQVIERQVGQMKHLIDDLLEVSRITSGNLRLRKAPVRVGDIVERALETARPLIASRRQQLTLSLPPHPVWLHADATRLEQVLVNLLNNAAKYTDEGGRLWLSVAQEGDAGAAAGGAVAVIEVRDAGMGIAAELLPHVFDLFTQGERTMDRSQGGMGIGLSLVRQLVEMHQGSVEVHSILGQGSEFVVRLPVGQAAVPLLSLPRPVVARSTGRRCRVLAVDDSVDAVEFLARLLRLSGHEVEVAYDGPSAVQTALVMRPDVVLLDIGLPGITGYEVARQLRQEAALKHTVLVALTGYGRASDRQRSRNAGFSYHLVKPAGVREVEEILVIVDEQLALQASSAPAVAPGE